VNAWTSGRRSTPSGRIHRLQFCFHKNFHRHLCKVGPRCGFFRNRRTEGQSPGARVRHAMWSGCTALAPRTTVLYSCLRTRSRSKRSTQTGINQYCNYWGDRDPCRWNMPWFSKFVFSCMCDLTAGRGFSSLGSLLSSPVRERARNDAWSISALLISRKNLFFSNQRKHDRLDSGWLREPRRDRLSHHWQSSVIPLILPQVPVHCCYITNVSYKPR